MEVLLSLIGLTITSPDIWKYLDKVCEVWGLRKYMNFNTEVIGCYWQDDPAEWLVKLKETKPDGSTRLFEDRCHMLLHGTGILNNFKWPKIEGMETFKGRVCFRREVAWDANGLDCPYSQMAQRLPSRTMEERSRGRHW